jgi:hypothetical protein
MQMRKSGRKKWSLEDRSKAVEVQASLLHI